MKYNRLFLTESVIIWPCYLNQENMVQLTQLTQQQFFYVIMFTSEEYALQDNTTIDGQIITSGKLVIKAQYLCSMQVDTNGYWDQHPQHNVITVPTHTILHTRLEVNTITYIHDIPKSVCNRTQAKKPHQYILYY